jgi:hypothetical protein
MAGDASLDLNDTDANSTLLTSGSKAAFTGSTRRTGEDGPKIIYLEPMADGGTQEPAPPFSAIFEGSHSTILRSHSTFCGAVNRRVPSLGLTRLSPSVRPKISSDAGPLFNGFRIGPICFQSIREGRRLVFGTGLGLV